MVDVNPVNKNTSVNVSSSGSVSQIKTTTPQNYYDGLAKQWAIDDGLVQGIDYSSKHYAQESAKSAQDAQAYTEQIGTIKEEAITEIGNTKNETIQIVQNASSNTIQSVAMLKESTLAEIENIKEDTINTIEASGTEALKDLEKEAQKQLQNVQSTGFYMRDDKLYFINSNGEEEEFKSGGGTGAGAVMFDTKIADHILEGDEALGWALQGTYVNASEYPDFYNKCLEEYQNSTDKVDIAWKQPVLVSNGVVGGDSFAVVASYEWTNQEAYKAFDGDSSTGYGSNTNNTPFWLTFYNPHPINVSKLTLTGREVATTNANIKIEACNDNSTWETLTTVTKTIAANNSVEIPVDTNNYYKYYRINFVSFSMPSTAYNCILMSVAISATQYVGVKNANGHQFYDIAIKSAVDEIYNQYGIADFYGIDVENERIFLPRNKYFHQLTDDPTKVNQIMEAGLPNITGRIYSAGYGSTGGYGNINGANGAFIKGSVSNGSGGAADSYSGNSSPYVDFDASLSNDIYGNSDTVQPPSSLKLLYYCVGNTEVTQAITNVTEVTTSENDTIPLFTGMYFDFKPNNVSWLKAGERQNNAGIYKTCYNTLVKIVNGVNNYDLKVINEDDMISGVVYDEYWILDQDNLTFRTPLTISSRTYESIAPVVGNGMTLGLKGVDNYYGGLTTTSASNPNLNWSTEAYGKDAGIQNYYGTGVSVGTVGVTTDPTKSGIEAHLVENTTAQLYFKVANAVQNLELLDAGEALETMVNIIPDNSSLIARYAMPADRAITLTVGATGAKYTAPANGYFIFQAVTNRTNYVSTISLTAEIEGILMDGSLTSRGFGYASQIWIYSWVPVRAGQTVYTRYDNIQTSNAILRFIYAEGEL